GFGHLESERGVEVVPEGAENGSAEILAPDHRRRCEYHLLQFKVTGRFRGLRTDVSYVAAAEVSPPADNGRKIGADRVRSQQEEAVARPALERSQQGLV